MSDPTPPLNDAAHDRRIDYIELPSTDIAATKRFYGEVFGWRFTDYGPEYTSFEDGRITGGFHKVDAVTAGGALIVIFALDLVAAELAVKAEGGTIVKETFDFPGGRRFHFADPGGYEMAIWSDR